MTNSTDVATDVLVVGAGPAGFVLACGLRLQGVTVRVVDQAAGPATTSRANILHARGVEVLDRLGALGGTVEWNTALVGAAQDDHGVTGVLNTGAKVRAGWLAGCDGAHSLVRKLAGIRFPGAPLTDSWLLTDAHADFDLPRAGGHGWAHPDGPLLAMPMPEPGTIDAGSDAGGGSLWRLMAYLPGVTAGS